MNLLRRLENNFTSPIPGNFRPVQPLNDRTVRASFQVPEQNTATTTAAATPATTTSTGATDPSTVSIELEAGSSAVDMTAGLFLSMLFAAHFVH